MSDMNSLTGSQTSNTSINFTGNIKNPAIIAGGAAVAGLAIVVAFVLVKRKIAATTATSATTAIADEPERKLEEGFGNAKVFKFKKQKRRESNLNDTIDKSAKPGESALKTAENKQ